MMALTIIQLSEAPNPLVAPPTLQHPRIVATFTVVIFTQFEGKGGGQKTLSGRVPMIPTIKEYLVTDSSNKQASDGK